MTEVCVTHKLTVHHIEFARERSDCGNLHPRSYAPLRTHEHIREITSLLHGVTKSEDGSPRGLLVMESYPCEGAKRSPRHGEGKGEDGSQSPPTLPAPRYGRTATNP